MIKRWVNLNLTQICQNYIPYILLKVFVIVIPKEGLAGWGPASPSLGMTRTIKYYCLFRLYSVVGVIPKEGLVGPQPANPSFGMTTTKMLRSVFSWHVSLMFNPGSRFSLGSYHFLPGRGKDFWGWSRVGGKIFYKVNEGVRIFSWVQEGIFFFHLWHDFLYFPYQQIFLKTSYAGPLTFLSIHYAYIHTCIYFIYIIGSWLYYSRGRLRYLTPRQGARVFFARAKGGQDFWNVGTGVPRFFCAR